MKKTLSNLIISSILICFSITFCGCWDYIEMHDIKFAAGVAIDKDKFTNEYILTIELLKSAADGKSIKSDIVQGRGKTLHIALRDVIKKTGKQLQVAHMKVVIISKDIAEEGIVPVVDLMNRDMEVRNDMWILISQMSTSSEIFIKEKKEEAILSYDLANAVANYNKSGKYVATEVFKLIDDISNKGISATAPLVKIDAKDAKPTVKISGTVVFKDDKMVGQLTEDETSFLQLLKEKEIKFIMPITLDNNEHISLELMNVSRKIKPKTESGKLSMNVYIDINVALSELAETGKDYVSKEQRERLKEQIEKYIDNSTCNLIRKLQKQYKSDVIGFGDVLKKKKPDEWEKNSDNWNEVFENMDINVFSHLNIKYSGATNKNIKVSD